MNATKQYQAISRAGTGNGLTWKWPLFAGAILVILLSATAKASGAEKPTRTLRGHIPAALKRLSPSGLLPTTNRLNLAIGLPLSDQKGLDDFIAQVSDPAGPHYRQYLTPAQFAQKFGPTEADYARVAAFARQNNLTVMAAHANRLVLDVNGTVEDIQKAFHLTLRTYPHPTEARDFYAPDVEPTVDAELQILDISGLSNYILPHPKHLRLMPSVTTANGAPRTGSASGGAYLGNDFRAAYVPDVTLEGTGQMLGLLEFDGFYAHDIDTYENQAKLPAVPLQTVLLDGYNGVPTRGPDSGNDEVSLDIEVAIAMAPGLANVIVFEAGPNGLQNDILSSMAASNQVKQLSCSWGWGGGPDATTDNIFKQMAAQGQSFFDASGDSDAFTSGQVDDTSQTFAPASCPFITQVGGTTLTTSAPGGPWSSETVWNDGGGEGSSGGISSYYSIPSWQTGISTAANGGSSSHRNIPDVALVADNIYVYYGNGKSGTFVGTSCAAPLWAAFTALVNQQAVQGGRPAVGFLNPALYALGKSAGYAASFHDITTGDNTWSSSPNAFHAVAGYDLCTGWGTPTGKSLIDALSGPPDPLGIISTASFTANGPKGGPFSPSSSILSLTNSGSDALKWSLVNTALWLMTTPNEGTLPPGATTNVTVELSPAARDLDVGTYSTDLTLTNWNSHATQEQSFTVRVGQSLVENGGFETGDFSEWTLVGNSTVSNPNGSTLYNGVEGLSNYSFVVHSGNYGVFLGDTQLATVSQNIPTAPGQAYLLSFWLDNPTNGTVQRFLVNWIQNGTVTNTLYDISNPPVIPWTNLQFVVTASGTNTILQFAAENDPNAFGLDDVTLTPIPPVVILSAAIIGGEFKMSWQTVANVAYQVQYKTNLSQSGWINLGTPIIASGSSSTTADTNNLNSVQQKFYRLVVSP